MYWVEISLNFIDKIFASSKQKKLDEANQSYEAALEEHQDLVEIIRERYVKDYAKYKANLKKWNNQKNIYEIEVKEKNEAIDKKKQQYFAGESEAIMEYCDIVLSNYVYPDYFPQEFDIYYNPDNRTVIVEYSLPDISDLPTLKEVKYIATKDEFKETYITEAALMKMYDKLLYDITLRTLHELFEADAINAIDSIVFNGWVSTINKATGKTRVFVFSPYKRISKNLWKFI